MTPAMSSRREDVAASRRRVALVAIADGLQRVAEGLLSLADAEGDDEAAESGPSARRRAWRAPSRPKPPSPADLATVTTETAKKAELALRKRGLV